MNILAIVGSYRKGQTVDTLIDKAHKLGKRLAARCGQQLAGETYR